jgi:hypothetical protein
MNSAPKLQLGNYGNYGDSAGLQSTAVTAILSPQFNSRLWELHDWMSTDCFGSAHADHIQSRRHLFSLYDVRMEAGQ